MTCKINADTSDGLKIVSDTSGAIDFQKAGSTQVVIDTNGNIGAGTTSPTHLADAYTTIEAKGTATNGSGVILATSAAGIQTQMISSDASGIGTIGTRTNHPCTFSINNSEKMRIQTTGNILLGKTSESYGTDGWCIKQNGRMHSSVSVSDDNIALDKDGNGNFIYFSTGTSQRGQISYDGSNVLYGTSSDYRLKENVNYSFDATTRLKQLKPARFNWISDDTNTAIDGFLAHEVSNVVPNAVYGDKDGTKTTTKIVKDKDGAVIEADIEEADWTAGKSSGLYPSDSTWTASESKEEYQTLDPSKLVPLLVKTIQELEARITALESE